MSRTDARSGALRHRPSRVVPATLVALVLLVLGVALVWATVLALVDGSWPSAVGRTHQWFAAVSWGSTTGVVLSIAVAVVGLVLLICALKAGPPNAVALDGTGSADGIATTDFVMTRRSVGRLAVAHANTIDGVDSVSATVTGRKVTLAVRTPSTQADEIAQQVNGRVRDALQAAGLSRVPAVDTNVSTHRP